MKKYIILSLATLSLLSTTSCMDDYLNEPSPSEIGTVAPDAAYNSIDNATAVLAGMLRQQRNQWSGYSTTDAGGFYAMQFARAVKGSDIQLSGSHYNFDYQNDNREPTYRRPGFSWRYPYMMIGRANLFIDGVEKSTGIGESDKPALIAQAKAFRGFYYFQLALEFNFAYKYNPQAAAPPVYTEIDLTGKPMGTLEELYKQILDDLNYAVNNASISRPDNSWINKQVAAGMLSNVYLMMENWVEAENMAKLAYGGDVLSSLHTITTYKPKGFDDAGDKEWLWSMTQQGDQTNYYWSAPHTFMGRDGYDNGYINDVFYGTFAANDRRKEAISVTNSSFAPSNVRYYRTDKFIRSFTSAMSIYRTPEFVLIAAESAARQGKEAEAQNILNQFKSTRYTGFVNQNLTGQALIDEILMERRKEMYGENGVEWYDAKRLQKGIKRSGNHAVLVELAPNDKRFILKIPQVEIDNNPNIDESVNADR